MMWKALNRSWRMPLIIFVCILTLGIYFLFKSKSHDRLVPIKRGPIVEAVYGIGTIKSRREYALKLGVTDRLAKLFVQEGDRVKKGAKLLELEDAHLFFAPFAGTIRSLPFHVGETVFPQTVVLSMADLLDRYMLVSLEQQGALRIQKDQNVSISFDALRGELLKGSVHSIYPRDDEFLVNVEIENLPKQILPGMVADVAIEIEKRENALLVPAQALSRGKLLVERNGKRLKVDVQIGSVDAEWAEVLGGDLLDSDLIVVKKVLAS